MKRPKVNKKEARNGLFRKVENVRSLPCSSGCGVARWWSVLRRWIVLAAVRVLRSGRVVGQDDSEATVAATTASRIRPNRPWCPMLYLTCKGWSIKPIDFLKLKTVFENVIGVIAAP